MRSKLKFICGSCGARMSGIGDWVEHACDSGTAPPPVYGEPKRRRSRPARSYKPDRSALTNRITLVSDPTRAFEDLLTAEDRVWMREIERAFD